MGVFRFKIDNPLGGLVTSRSESGLPVHYFSKLRNVRLQGRTLRRRNGMKRVIGTLNTSSSALIISPCDYGDPSYIRIPLIPEVHQLGTRWTIDTVINPDEIVSTGPNIAAYILGFDAEDSDTVQPWRLMWTSKNQIYFSMTDENGNTYELLSEESF